MSELSRLVGSRIRNLRKMQHLSQGELAARCGLHPAYIGQLERGERNATRESIQSICRGLRITMDQLFYGIKLDDTDAGGLCVTNQINQMLGGLAEKDRLTVYHILLEILELKS